MKNNMKILGIVVLYNFNNENIDNIKTYCTYCNKIIAIDNSENKCKDNIKKIKEIKNLEYLNLDGNYGIAKALNIGMQYAIANEYEWVLTMDQDSRFNNNIIDVYFKTLKDELLDDIAVISPNYFFDRKKNKIYNGYKKLQYTMQSGNLVNVEIYKKIGEFKEEFFIDGVDYEYCIRANKNKYKIIECGNAVLYHRPATTKRTFFGFKYGYCNSTRIYYQVRNLLWISKRYCNLKMILIVIYKLFKIVFLFDNKIEYLRMFRLGVKDYKKDRLGKLIDE